MVDLTQIDLATEEDRAYGIDYWARFFKAKTWEEIKMLAKDNECMQEAVHSIYMANADEMVRQRCLAREEAERHERTMLRDIRILTEKNEELAGKNEELAGKITELTDMIAELSAELACMKEQMTGTKE